MPLKFIKKIFSWLIDIPETTGPQGTEIATASTDKYIPKIYGQVSKHQGTIIFKGTSNGIDNSTPNELLHIIIVWAESVQSIDTVYLDDVDASTDSALFVSGSNRYAHVRNFANGMGAYSYSELNEAGWRATDTVDGKACSYIRLQYANGENLLRSEPKITADITGTSFSNPALCLRDYLESNVYGKGLSSSQIDLTALSAVQTYCDTQVETYNGSGVNRKLFTCNVAVDTGSSVFDNTNRILKSFRGLMPVLNGKLTPIVEKDDAAVSVQILENDIVKLGSINNSSKGNRFNRVIVEYVDSEENGTKQEAVYPAKDSATETTWLAEDNGVVLEKKVTLDTCNNFYEALNYAKIYALISREQLKTEITLDIWATIYEAGDIVEVTHSQLGWNAKKFRIDATSQESDQVILSIREHQPYIYANDNNEIKPVIPDTSNTLTLPAAPTSLTVIDFYNSLKQLEVTWSGTTTRYEVIVKDSSDIIVDNLIVSQKKYIARNYEFDTYTIEVRAINSLNMRSVVASTTFVIDENITDFTWIVYAEDANGLNASLTDSASKTHIGIKSGQDVALTNISQITGVQFGYFDKPTGGTAGASGSSIYTVNVYQRSATEPDKPADDSASYNFGTDVLTPPSGWSVSIPTGSNPIWVTTTTFSVTGATGTDSTCTFTDVAKLAEDGENGTSGTSYREISIFRRSASALGAPTGGSYNFDTDTLTPPTNWSFQPPAGSDPLYTSRGVASVLGNTGTDSSITWSSPTLFVKDGNDGNSAPIPIITDNGDGTYTIDNQDGDVITFNDGLDGYTPQLGIDYFDGVSGEYVSFIYLNAENKPDTPTGGTFNGTSESFPTNWSDTPSDFTLPNKRWVSVRRYENNPRTDTWTVSQDWTTPSLQAEIGEVGPPGTNGTNGTNGQDGVDGLTAYEIWLAEGNSGTQQDFLNSLNGADGQDGSNGQDGSDGQSAYQIWLSQGNSGTAEDFIQSLNGSDGVDGNRWYSLANNPTSGLGQIDDFALVAGRYVWRKTSSTVWTFLEDLRGPAGTNGINGSDGSDGIDGLSAYEIWLAEGNSGTNQDFINSLKGADGQDGSNGANGSDGADGQSAYEIWLSQGNSGTAETFIQSLNGSDGIDGNRWYSLSSNPTSGLGVVDDFALVAGRYVWQKTSSTVWTYIEDLLGPAGNDGQDGQNGADGQDGADGKDGITADAITSVKNQRWGFKGSTHGWVGTTVSTTLTTNSSYLTVTASNNDPGIQLPNLGTTPNSQTINGSKYFAIRVKIRTTSASHSTVAEFYYGTGAHGFSGSFRNAINVDYVQNEWTYLVFDMRDLNQGGNDWIDNTITSLRLDFANSGASGKTYEIDGIVVGEFSAGELNATGQAINYFPANYQNPLTTIPFYQITRLNASVVRTNLSNDPPSGGNYYQLIATSTTNDAYITFAYSSTDYNVRVPSNKKFIISYYARRASGSTGLMQAYFRFLESSVLTFQKHDGSYVEISSTEWQRYSFIMDMTGHPSVNQVQLRLDNDGDLNSAIWVDNIMIEVLEDDLNPIPSPYAPPFNQRPVFNYENLLMNINAGVGSSLSSNPISAADVGTTARITIGAHTLQFPDGTVSYNSGTISGLSFDTRYYIYVDDPYYLGGSVTYSAVTSSQITNISSGIGRRYLGSITTPGDGGGGTVPPPFDCPHVDMWLSDTLQVKDVKVGDVIDGVQFGIQQVAKVTATKEATEDCVKITTQSGYSVIVSVTTPIERKGGSTFVAINAWGELVQIEKNSKLIWELVTDIEFMANQPVKHISLDNISFLSGCDKNRRIVTHNSTIKP